MGVPMIGQIGTVRRTIAEGDLVLVDGGEATALVRPTSAIEDAFDTQFAATQKRRAEYAAVKDKPAVTTDGTRISVMVNAGLRDDVAALDASGADGIGLFRTEFQFLVSATLPRQGAQQRLYRAVLDAAGDKPVIFRTVDVGGDKSLPYLNTSPDNEENPAMGWRALRLALDRDGLMKSQARALLEAAAGRELQVMFPMVSEPWEFDAARAIVEEQRAWLAERKKALPRRVLYGAMLEVPSLAEMLDVLLPRLDFLSIGTNDLTQFLFAADRSNPRLAERYDWLSPAILRFLRRIVRAADKYQVPIGVCGEMGGRTLEAMALIGIGVRRLSITPVAVGPIKAMIRSLDARAAGAALDRLLAKPPENMRAALAKWAERHGVAMA
jgi:phosphotransferase system enzyme I (PtsP)